MLRRLLMPHVPVPCRRTAKSSPKPSIPPPSSSNKGCKAPRKLLNRQCSKAPKQQPHNLHPPSLQQAKPPQPERTINPPSPAQRRRQERNFLTAPAHRRVLVQTNGTS